jgi:hypothetical protein
MSAGILLPEFPASSLLIPSSFNSGVPDTPPLLLYNSLCLKKQEPGMGSASFLKNPGTIGVHLMAGEVRIRRSSVGLSVL